MTWRTTAVLVAVALAAVACGRAEAGAVDETTTSTVGSTTTASTASTLPSTTTTTAPVVVTYVVQTGDALGVIAQRFGISSELLASHNGIDDPNKIFVGQNLTIPPADATTTTAAESETTSSG